MGDPACWSADFSEEACCSGKLDCWDLDFTFERCCPAPPFVSIESLMEFCRSHCFEVRSLGIVHFLAVLYHSSCRNFVWPRPRQEIWQLAFLKVAATCGVVAFHVFCIGTRISTLYNTYPYRYDGWLYFWIFKICYRSRDIFYWTSVYSCVGTKTRTSVVDGLWSKLSKQMPLAFVCYWMPLGYTPRGEVASECSTWHIMLSSLTFGTYNHFHQEMAIWLMLKLNQSWIGQAGLLAIVAHAAERHWSFFTVPASAPRFRTTVGDRGNVMWLLRIPGALCVVGLLKIPGTISPRLGMLTFWTGVIATGLLEVWFLPQVESQFESWSGPCPTTLLVGLPLMVGVVALLKSSKGVPPSTAMSRVAALSLPVLLLHGHILEHLMEAPYAVFCAKSSCNFVALIFLLPGVYLFSAALGALSLFIVVLPSCWFINLCGRSASLRLLLVPFYVVVFFLAASPWVFETGRDEQSLRPVACPLSWFRFEIPGIANAKWGA